MKAFPTYEWNVPHQQMMAVGGMDLRDYFAAKALQGFLASTTTSGASALAKDSYKMADAMMEARKL